MNLKAGETDYGKVNMAIDYETCWGNSSYLFPSSLIKNYKSNIYFDCEARRNYEDMNPYLYWGTKMCYENVVSEAKSISIAAYGLSSEEIIIKEVDGKLTIVSNSSGVSSCRASLSKSYTLKNVRLDSTTLSLGVLTLNFVDTENVVIHKVNNGG
jgi:hypothetical protein